MDLQSFKAKNPEYVERFNAAQAGMALIVPADKVLGRKRIGKTNFVVINRDILETKADVVVSSDDNHFSAAGGVARAILERAGPDISKQLESFRTHPFRQGELAITTGGVWSRRAIIHPAVIDLDENRYPTVETIKTLVRRCLSCALALGAQRIAFPVLGGGTASKHLKAQDSVRALVEEIIAYFNAQAGNYEGLTYVELCIFNPDDARGLPAEMTGS